MSQQLADVMISSNAIFTDVSNQPESASIVIKDNKILAIGSEEEALEMIRTFVGLVFLEPYSFSTIIV